MREPYIDNKGKLTIGNDVLIEPFASIVCWHKVTIGDNVQIAAGARIVDFEHKRDGDKREKGEVGEVVIGDWTIIGSNAVILKGVRLGKHCIVGAGAVVTHSFPDGSTIVGNPARLI